jgi:hypothetical protein
MRGGCASSVGSLSEERTLDWADTVYRFEALQLQERNGRMGDGGCESGLCQQRLQLRLKRTLDWADTSHGFEAPTQSATEGLDQLMTALVASASDGWQLRFLSRKLRSLTRCLDTAE